MPGRQIQKRLPNDYLDLSGQLVWDVTLTLGEILTIIGVISGVLSTPIVALWSLHIRSFKDVKEARDLQQKEIADLNSEFSNFKGQRQGREEAVQEVTQKVLDKMDDLEKCKYVGE